MKYRIRYDGYLSDIVASEDEDGKSFKEAKRHLIDYLKSGVDAWKNALRDARSAKEPEKVSKS